MDTQQKTRLRLSWPQARFPASCGERFAKFTE